MAQLNRYTNRMIDIEFIYQESFETYPYANRYTMTFITSGYLKGWINNYPVEIEAPAILCLSQEDHVSWTDIVSTAAQTLAFSTQLINLDALRVTKGYVHEQLKKETGIGFFRESSYDHCLPYIHEKSFPQLFEWFFTIGTEVYAQSNQLWVCRIRRYLIQILEMLEYQRCDKEESPIDNVLRYIHVNYAQKISLKDLTDIAYMNRVSLNAQFQERVGCTAMNYLFQHRMKTAENLLTHTSMTLNEIANATGFAYDTYFIKQFSAKKGMTPTQFREYTKESRFQI